MKSIVISSLSVLMKSLVNQRIRRKFSDQELFAAKSSVRWNILKHKKTFLEHNDFMQEMKG